MPLKFLNQPYPFGGSHKSKVPVIVCISFFVFAFLLLFKPFGLSRYPFSYNALVSLGFGVSCGLAMTLNCYGMMPLIPTYFNEEKWTVGRQLLWFTVILLTISIFNTIFAAIIGLYPFSFSQFITLTAYVLLIGIFPVCAVVAFDYWRLLKKHEKQAQKLKSKLQMASRNEKNMLVLNSANRKEKIQLKQDQLLYLTSEDNYVGVIYRDGLEIQKKLLRGSLKSFEKQLIQSAIIRCHRSYMVNLTQVISISGNAQGYLLKLRNGDYTIPVSRSYTDDILSRFDS